MKQYCLTEARQIILEPDPLKWLIWFGTGQPKVGLDQIGRFRISTVFLGVDYNHRPIGPPILWETMVFNQRGEPVQMDHCAGDWDQAEAMHAAMVAKYQKRNHRPK